MTERRVDVDWLRIAATYLLFVFHAGKIFDPAPFYHVRNAELSTGMLVLCGFIGLWHMPLFFLLAGWSIDASVRRRGRGSFVRERLWKLGVPLVAGTVLFGPVVKWVELRSGLDLGTAGLRVAPQWQEGFRQVIPGGVGTLPPFEESLVAFWPTFFTHGLERFTWMHLWFLAYLLVLSVVWLPLLEIVGRGPRRFERHARVWVWAPLVPLVATQVWLRPRWPGVQNLYDDWANIAYYSTYLVAGFCLGLSPVLERAAHEAWRAALWMALAAGVVLLLGVAGVVRQPALVLAASAVAGWGFVLAILAAGRRWLVGDGPAFRWLRESAFPVYVLHQVAVVLVGFAVVRWELGIATKFALIVAGALAATLAVYRLAVRPYALPRWLLGMPAAAAPARAPDLRARTPHPARPRRAG